MTSFVPYPEAEKHKSHLLLQAALLRSEGEEELAAVRFAEAAVLEENLTRQADLQGQSLRAARSHFSAASAWANAGNFFRALELLQSLDMRADAPEPLKAHARIFAETLRVERRHWHDILQEASLT